MQAILITASLVLVMTMVASLSFAALRSRPTPDVVPMDSADDTV